MAKLPTKSRVLYAIEHSNVKSEQNVLMRVAQAYVDGEIDARIDPFKLEKPCVEKR